MKTYMNTEHLAFNMSSSSELLIDLIFFVNDVFFIGLDIEIKPVNKYLEMSSTFWRRQIKTSFNIVRVSLYREGL